MEFTHKNVMVGVATLALAGCANDSQVGVSRSGEVQLGLATVCESTIIGGDDQCLPVDAFSDHAGDLCASKGQTVGQVGFAKACGPGLWRIAKVDCCRSEEEEVAPAPEPEPVEATCHTEVVGGDCQSQDSLKAAAATACGDKAVTDLSWGGECAGGWRFAKASCCEQPDVPVDPPPAPSTDGPPCQVVDVLMGGLCVDPAVIDARAKAECAALGLSLTSVTSAGDCGDGTFAGGKATCCEIPPSTNPPSADVACTTGLAGGVGDCRSASQWHEFTANACRKQGLSVSSFETVGECASGAPFAKFSCCPVFEQADRCIVKNLGGDGYCAPASAWKASAEALCAASGRAVEAVGVTTSCGPGLWRGSQVACCGAQVAMPSLDEGPSSQCFESTIQVPVCKGMLDWQIEGARLCRSRRAGLEDVVLSAPCVGGGADVATISCCQGEADKVCKLRTLKMPLTCLSELELQKAAKEICELDGQSLHQLVGDTKCKASGKSQSITFECCD